MMFQLAIILRSERSKAEEIDQYYASLFVCATIYGLLNLLENVCVCGLNYIIIQSHILRIDQPPDL